MKDLRIIEDYICEYTETCLSKCSNISLFFFLKKKQQLGDQITNPENTPTKHATEGDYIKICDDQGGGGGDQDRNFSKRVFLQLPESIDMYP